MVVLAPLVDVLAQCGRPGRVVTEEAGVDAGQIDTVDAGHGPDGVVLQRDPFGVGVASSSHPSNV